MGWVVWNSRTKSIVMFGSEQGCIAYARNMNAAHQSGDLKAMPYSNLSW